MPCNLGYRRYVPTVITPVEKTLKQQAEAPTVDADLLSKLGSEDPAFLATMQNLDMKKLQAHALEKAKAKVPNTDELSIQLAQNGALVMEGTYVR